MAEVTKEMIYEAATAVYAHLGNIEEGLHELRGDFRDLCGHQQIQALQFSAMRADLGNLSDAFTAMDSRLYRIERRLDIVEAPVT